MQTPHSRVRAAIAAALVASFLVAGCQAPTVGQQKEYDRLVKAKVKFDEPYKPGLAAALNILPGVGDAYIGEWGPAVINLLLWPYSVLWGVPEAYCTAKNKNVKEVVDDRRYREESHDSSSR